jgi:hypothetical protein
MKNFLVIKQKVFFMFFPLNRNKSTISEFLHFGNSIVSSRLDEEIYDINPGIWTREKPII